jgi:hypothetical protein
MIKTLTLVGFMAIATGALAAETMPTGLLFSEGFENADLTKRDWYDGTGSRIVGGSRAGKGCIEYEWPDRDSKTIGSSTLRHLFEPTDEVFIRFYLKLSKGWGWTGRNYHPHLINILTTENAQWHGPAASHLTLYIEPQEGNLRLAAQDIQNKDKPPRSDSRADQRRLQWQALRQRRRAFHGRPMALRRGELQAQHA